MVQPSARHSRSRMIIALRWRGLEQARGAAEVEDLGLAAEHGGDDLGGAGEAAYLAGGQLVRGSELGGAELLAQVVEGDRDDQRGGIAAVSGQPLGVDGLQQRTERLAAFAVDRDPVGLPQTRLAPAGDVNASR